MSRNRWRARTGSPRPALAAARDELAREVRATTSAIVQQGRAQVEVKAGSARMSDDEIVVGHPDLFIDAATHEPLVKPAPKRKPTGMRASVAHYAAVPSGSGFRQTSQTEVKAGSVWTLDSPVVAKNPGWFEPVFEQ